MDDLASVDYCHWCPDCEEPREACHCDDYDPPDDDSEHETGCCFPDRCLMPGEHMRSECHDIEMVEAQYREDGGT